MHGAPCRANAEPGVHGVNHSSKEQQVCCGIAAYGSKLVVTVDQAELGFARDRSWLLRVPSLPVRSTQAGDNVQ
jgi:hypothetical protein